MDAIKDRAQIPNLLCELHPNMSHEEYFKLKKNPKFYLRTIKIC
jgi:hypothetical protein